MHLRSWVAAVFLLLAIPAAASAAAASPPTVAFGNVPINTTVSQSITITVDSGYRTEIASGSGLNMPFSFDFDTCGAGGGFSGPGTCTVKESYHPTALTASSGTTNVFECPIAGGSCLTIPYTVSGTGISLAAASPPTVAFGNVPINTTVSQSITITVDSGYRTEIASGSGLNMPFSFDFDTCGAGGGFSGPGTCTVKESYHPTALTASSGTTNVFECPIAGGSCLTIPYTVSGTGISLAAASPPTVAFGNVPINTTVSQSITITVDSGYRTEIASGSGLNMPFSFDFDTCGAGGGFSGPGTCTVKESYHPTALTASSGTTNVFECPIAGGSCLTIPYTVSGTGISLAAASPPTVAFGNVPINTTVSQSITITVDSGYRTEIASGSGLNMPFSFDFDTCGAGGGFSGPGTCTVKESYHPTALTASSGTTNVFECPIAGGSCLTIPYTVSGTGISLAAASPPTVAFGNVPINTTVSQSITITVDSGYRTEIASGSGLNMPFSFDFDTCGAGGGFSGPGTCTVKESYHPTALTASSGTTNVFECPIAGGSCLTIPYTVSGTGISLAAASPPTVAFGNVPINTTVSQSITITVDSGYRTEIASGSGLNMPFSFDFDTCGAGGGFSGPGTCTVKESYHPTALTASSGTTNVFECPIAGGSCLTIPYTVSGTGISLASLMVTPATPTIAAGTDQQFTATGTYSDGSTADLTTSVNWTSDTLAAATIDATTGLAHGVSPGTSTISATLGAVSGHTLLTVSQATVKLNQTITFANPGAQTMADSPLTVSATASSGLAVTFTTSTPSVCTAGGENGATITFVAPGMCTVLADQPGNAVYNPASTVSRNFKVKQLNQTITFANPGAQTMADSPLTVSATASSGLAVTFTTSTPSVCTAGGRERGDDHLRRPRDVHRPGRPARQRRLQPGLHGEPELQGQAAQPDDHVRQPRRPDDGRLAAHGQRDGLLGSRGDVHDVDPVGLHRGWRERGDDHLRRPRDVHRPGRPARQRRLQPGLHGEPELQGQAAQPDDHVRQPRRPDDGRLAAHGQRDGLLGSRGDVHDVDPVGLHRGWRERGDDHLRRPRDVHRPGRPARQRRLQPGLHGEPELQGGPITTVRRAGTGPRGACDRG